jgi:hypothetical protein
MESKAKTAERTARLSAAGLANIAASQFENDFAFIVGGERHECPRFAAAFLSPRIARLQSSDPSFCEFEIKTADRCGEFGDFLSLGRSGSVSVTSENIDFFVSIAGELENSELYLLLRGSVGDSATVSSFWDRFQDSGFFESPLISSDVISFIASHFCDFDRSFLRRLPISTLILVLSHESLTIASEDLLYDFVISLFDVESTNDGSAVALLELIRYEYLSASTIRAFVEWISSHFEVIGNSVGLWRALSVRLSLSVSVSPSLVNSRFRILAFHPSADGSLDGIIAYLSRECGGNVHERGIVDISAKGTIGDAFSPKSAADLQGTNLFQSENGPDQWLCYDFKTRCVRPTHYSIHAHRGYWLRWWVLEGSADGLSWSLLDEQKDNSTTNPTHPIGTFSVSRSSEWRFIRLRQTGKNGCGDFWVLLHAFELFGELLGAVAK